MYIQHFCAVCHNPVPQLRFLLCKECHAKYGGNAHWVLELKKDEAKRRRALWRNRSDEIIPFSAIPDSALDHATKLA